MKPAVRSLLRFVAIAVVMVVLAGVLLAVWLLSDGWRTWSRVEKGLLAKGERLALSENEPPMVLESDNFFLQGPWADLTLDPGTSPMVPRIPEGQRATEKIVPPIAADEAEALRERFAIQWPDELKKRGSVAQKISKGSEVSRETAEAVMILTEPGRDLAADILKGPGRGRLPLNYVDGVQMHLPQLGVIMEMSYLLTARAKAELILGKTESAMNNLRALFKLQELIGSERVLILQLVRSTSAGGLAEAVDLGLRLDRWSDADLRELGDRLGRIDLVAGLIDSLRLERGVALEALARNRGDRKVRDQFWTEMSRQVSPPGEEAKNPTWWVPQPLYRQISYYDQAAFSETVQGWIDALEVADRQGISPGSFDNRKEELRKGRAGIVKHLYSLLSLPAISGAPLVTVVRQTAVDQARVACALERYRLERGHYPDALAELEPTYLSRLPKDRFPAEALKYKREGPEGYRLYSVGPDRKDEGGAAYEKKNKQGDLVWGVWR